jgi:hypothetical protein
MTRQLPVNTNCQGRKAEGFCTPKEDRIPQVMSIPPKRVLPIVFLPGIMGSNLRMSEERRLRLRKSNNIAWRPDHTIATAAFIKADPATRQLQLDMNHTEVDIYDPVGNPTGDRSETSAERHDNGRIRVSLNVGIDTPLLTDDLPTQSPRRTKEQKALERGWGEVYFSSYRTILERCEELLNTPHRFGNWPLFWGVAPAKWQAHPQLPLAVISEAELKKSLAGCFYPVHAMGYNWLQSCSKAGTTIAARAEALIQKYRSEGYQCEKVIIVTHSMGGLVARALIHPDMGNFAEKVLGIVHGVMPAVGAPAAYKRMRCGFEEGYFKVAPTPKILGNYGAEVTAVLANSEGGLELLPSGAYGNGWLQIRKDRIVLKLLPEKGDPYEEIYKVRGKWYGLIREEWLNPAEDEDASFDRTCKLLDKAKKFHGAIGETYHAQSYAHYGVDPARPSWEEVTWEVGQGQLYSNWAAAEIVKDDQHGNFAIAPDTGRKAKQHKPIDVRLKPSTGAGDQTVPARSADHQFLSGKFKGIFRQAGYEHQASYDDMNALSATMYSLVRIIQTMQWSSHG